MKKILQGLLAGCLCVGTALSDGDGRLDPDYSIRDREQKTVTARVFLPELLVGYAGGALDFSLSPTMSIGPTLRWFAFNHHGYEVGAEVQYAISGGLFQNAWVLNPFVAYAHLNYAQPRFVSTTVLGARLLYQHMLSDSLQVSGGFGVAYSDYRMPVTSFSGAHFRALYQISLGYNF